MFVFLSTIKRGITTVSLYSYARSPGETRTKTYIESNSNDWVANSNFAFESSSFTEPQICAHLFLHRSYIPEGSYGLLSARPCTQFAARLRWVWWCSVRDFRLSALNHIQRIISAFVLCVLCVKFFQIRFNIVRRRVGTT